MLDGDQLKLLEGYRHSQFIAVAAATLIWHDYLLTLPAERRFYWGTRWSWSRAIFTGNRYFSLLFATVNVGGALATNFTHKFCVFFSIYLVTLAGPASVFLIELVLTLRLYAMYGRSKKILLVLSAVLFCATFASATIVILEFGANDAIEDRIPGFRTCYAVDKHRRPKKFVWSYWIPIAIFESFAFVLALLKARDHLLEVRPSAVVVARRRQQQREGLGTSTVRKKNLGERIIEAMFRDSLLYFLLMSIIIVLGALLNRFGGENLGLVQIIAGPIQSMLSIMGSRLLLSTHHVVVSAFNPSSDTEGVTTGGGDIELADMSGGGGGSSSRSPIGTSMRGGGGDYGGPSLHLDTLASMGQVESFRPWHDEHEEEDSNGSGGSGSGRLADIQELE